MYNMLQSTDNFRMGLGQCESMGPKKIFPQQIEFDMSPVMNYAIFQAWWNKAVHNGTDKGIQT